MFVSQREMRNAQKIFDHLRCQEISIVLACDLASKVLSSQLEFVTLRSLCSQCISALLESFQSISLVDLLALGGCDFVLAPLPKLASRYFSGGSVLPRDTG